MTPATTTPDLAHLIGRAPRTFAAFIRDHAERFGATPILV